MPLSRLGLRPAEVDAQVGRVQRHNLLRAGIDIGDRREASPHRAVRDRHSGSVPAVGVPAEAHAVAYAAVQQLGFAVSGSKQPRWLELRQEAERILVDVYVRREAEAR